MRTNHKMSTICQKVLEAIQGEIDAYWSLKIEMFVKVSHVFYQVRFCQVCFVGIQQLMRSIQTDLRREKF